MHTGSEGHVSGRIGSGVLSWIVLLSTMFGRGVARSMGSTGWFYGIVGNDLARKPFADEAMADELARYITGIRGRADPPPPVWTGPSTATRGRATAQGVEVGRAWT